MVSGSSEGLRRSSRLSTDFQAQQQVMDISHSQLSTPTLEQSAGTSVIPDVDMSVQEDSNSHLLLNKDELHKQQRVNFISAIESMRVSPRSSSRFDVPLCRLIYMPLVRPTLESDIKRLEAEFTHGYRPGATVFYVSLTNDKDEECFVTDVDQERWGPLWRQADDAFEARLSNEPQLQFLKKRKLFVCDGNHRYMAWTGYIDRLHSNDASWHFSADCICLDIRGKVALVIHAMHDINRATENSHVKTNFVHILHRIKSIGTQPLESFKEVLSDEDFHKCFVNPGRVKSWYPLTVDVFISMLFRQEIADASDEGARIYKDNTLEELQSDCGITAAMRAAAKAKIQVYKGQWSKYSAIANPKLGDKFLVEITRHWSVNTKPEMTLEKLQLISTTNVPAPFKVRWLTSWNSSNATRAALHFLPKGFSDKDLDAWLNKASFWAGLEVAVAEEFQTIVKDDKLTLNSDIAVKICTPEEFVEASRIRLWEHAFPLILRSKSMLSWSKPFKDHKYIDLAVRRVLWRYFVYEVAEKGALPKDNLPKFVTSWCDCRGQNLRKLKVNKYLIGVRTFYH